MKKLFLRIIPSALLILLLSVSSCNKDDDYDFELQQIKNAPQKVDNLDKNRMPIKETNPLPDRPLQMPVETFQKKQ